jgi:hypothetical protein
MIDKPGKYQIGFEEYLKDPCPAPSLTRSTIKALINETPRRAFLNHPRLNPQATETPSEKFDIGTAAHDMFLVGSDVIRVILADDWRTNKAKAERDEARANGKVPLLEHQFLEVNAMVTAANEALLAWEGKGLRVKEGVSESTYIWQESNGIWFRIRPDWTYSGLNLCFDYKTTGQSADPQEYNRIAIANGHDIQDAFYRRGIKAIEGEEPDFIFMVQETEPPYLCAFHSLDMMAKDMGEQKVETGIKLWEKHLSTGRWPGYGNQTFTMEAPPWALAAWEMRKFTLEASHV